jgi:hypothetical protein
LIKIVYAYYLLNNISGMDKFSSINARYEEDGEVYASASNGRLNIDELTCMLW